MLINLRSVLKIIILMWVSLIMGCDVTSLDVPKDQFFIAKDWKIVEYYQDDNLMTNDQVLATEGGPIENYRLKLKDDFTFTRTFFDGTNDDGTWYLTAEGTYLNLDSDTPDVPRKWRIIKLEVRQLELLLIPGELGGRLSDLNIPLQARFILEPVKGQ